MIKEFFSVTTNFRVEFFDVDSMNVAWHGNYVKFMEIGRCALLDKIGYGYNAMKESGWAFPITEIKLKYVKPLHFEEKASIRASLIEYENCIRIKYEMFTEQGILVTKGESTQMAVNIKTGESQFVCPKFFIEKVENIIKKQGIFQN